MENIVAGYRFSPTDEELINVYLKNKILGNNQLIGDAITEINISSYDPMSLPSLSKIKTNDPVWYFFSPKYTSANMKMRKRTTRSGHWKVTGVSTSIKDKRGNGGEIGIKKVLVYYEGKVSRGLRSPWVMHEYDITCLPPDQRTYVICKVKYKGKDGKFLSGGNVEVGDIPSGGNNSSEICHSLVSDSTTVGTTNLTDMDKPQQNLPSVQRPVVDSNTVRAASFAKMYKLLQNLPSVERHGKLTSHGAP